MRFLGYSELLLLLVLLPPELLHKPLCH